MRSFPFFLSLGFWFLQFCGCHSLLQTAPRQWFHTAPLTHRSPALWVLAKAVVSKYCGQGISRLYRSRCVSGCVGLTRSCMERCILNFAFGWKLMLKPCVFVIEPESLIFLSWLISAPIKQLKHGQHHSNHQLLVSASYCRNLVPADLLSLDPTPASISDLFSPSGCFLELLRRVPGPIPAQGLPWVQALPVFNGFVGWDLHVFVPNSSKVETFCGQANLRNLQEGFAWARDESFSMAALSGKKSRARSLLQLLPG